MSAADVTGQSERRLLALFAEAADSSWTADEQGIVTSVAGGLITRLGLDPDEVVGRSAFDFPHPEDLPAFRAAWQRLMARQSARELVDIRVAGVQGWTWVRQTLIDLRAHPDVQAIAGIAVHLGELKAAQEAREALEQRFQARFDQSAIPQAMTDLAADLVAVNDAFCQLVGRSRGLLVGCPISSLNHARDPGEADSALALVLSGEHERAQAERVVTGRDGHPVPVLINLTAMRNATGQIEGAAVFWHDLTQLRDAEQQWQQAEAFFLILSRYAGDLALIGGADGRLTYVSPAVEHLLGYGSAELLGRGGWEFVHPDDLEVLRTGYLTAFSDGRATFLIRVAAKDGRWEWIEQSATNLLDTSVRGILCNLRVVTDRVLAEGALRSSETRYRAIVDTASQGIVTSTPDGVVTYANQQLASTLGIPSSEVYARRVYELLGPAAAEAAYQRLLGREERGDERYEVDYPHPDGGMRRLAIATSPVFEADGRYVGSLAMTSDVTEARRNERELAHAALYDAMTGLPNRTLLLDRLEHALRREATSTAVLFIDLDHFKLVNDSRGHSVGDQLLVVIAERLAGVVGAVDTVARFGGDEFVILCEDTDLARAESVADAVLAACQEPVELDGRRVHISASVGIALSPPSTAEELLRYADTAMYAAKKAGRGKAHLFDRALADDVEQRFQLASDLHRALAEGHLVMHYQPVVDLTSGSVLGMEALARWLHPEHGPVSPALFVPLAEDSGLALLLDTWALQQALRDAGELRAAGHLPPTAYVAVNLSALTLREPGLEQTVVAATRASGIPSSQVVLEITESAIMQNSSVAIEALGRLREQGFQVAVDDFGTGYSSLAYLRDLPVTVLKIDISFVLAITNDQDALAIVASIVDLARAVTVTVVAEGVETAEHAALLQVVGCQAGQGWLWSPALAKEDIPAARWTSLLYAPGGFTEARPIREDLLDDGDPGLDRLLAMHRSGASLDTIAAALNREGSRTPNGLRWHRSSVARAITRVVYPTL
jgi:diguanylate cyclase (GGDEF)-like protein/PAS domain S-box-containing protein